MKPIKVTLDEPIDGHEEKAEWRKAEAGERYLNDISEICIGPGNGFVGLVLTPKVKKYDWSKTSDKVLVDGPATTYLRGKVIDLPLSTEWIPYFGGECPFDEDAVVVQLFYRSGAKTRHPAKDISWGSLLGHIKAIRFVELVDGYSFT